MRAAVITFKVTGERVSNPIMSKLQITSSNYGGFPEFRVESLSIVTTAELRLEHLQTSGEIMTAAARGPGMDHSSELPHDRSGITRPLIGYPGQDRSLIESPLTVWSKFLVGSGEYFPQPNDWSCGASVYIMALRTLKGQDVPLQEALRITEARIDTGTDNFLLQKAFEQLKPEFEVIAGITSHTAKYTVPDAAHRYREQQAEYTILKQLLTDGYLVVLNFREPVEHEGHYGILQGINEKAIAIGDPWYGNHSVLALEQFDFRSGFTTPVLHGWFLAIRPAAENNSQLLSNGAFSVPI